MENVAQSDVTGRGGHWFTAKGTDESSCKSLPVSTAIAAGTHPALSSIVGPIVFKTVNF
jgi:hypothetical protein